MPRFLFAICLLFIIGGSLPAVQVAQEAIEIAAAIDREIQTSEPVLLYLNTGEWTTSLTQVLSSSLIARGIDLRIDTGFSSDPEGFLSPEEQQVNLAKYGIGSALLVQVSLNLKWEEYVQKSFFSYRSERRPIYSFEIRQIHLPDQTLTKISAYDFHRQNAPETEVSRLRLRWFEPIVASAAIASMVFLLWNFN